MEDPPALETSRPRRAVAAVVLAIASLLLPVGVAQGQETPPSGGSLTLGLPYRIEQLNPFFGDARARVASAPVLRGLFALDGEGSWVPDLAAEVPTAANGGLVPDRKGKGISLTLRLKPGLAWSDGTPLTLHDLAWTYDWAAATGAAGVGCTGCAAFVPLVKEPRLGGERDWSPRNRLVESIEVSDDGLEATVHWKRPYPGWAEWAATPLLPRHAWAGILAARAAAAARTGDPDLSRLPWSGPFTVTAANADAIDYARNDYWRATDPAPLDGLRLRSYDGAGDLIASFGNGEIDLALGLGAGDYPDLAEVDQAVGRAVPQPDSSYVHLDMNAVRPGLRDIEVRRAIAEAIDAPGLAASLAPDLQLQPACAPTPPLGWWHVDASCGAADPQAARARLDEAGWDLDPATGLRTSDGRVLRLRLCTASGDELLLAAAGRIARALGDVGIAVDIQTEDAESRLLASWADVAPEQACSVYRGSYDLALYATTLGVDPHAVLRSAFHSSQVPGSRAPGGRNATRVRSDSLDEAIEALGSAMEPEVRRAALDEALAALAAEAVSVPLFHPAAPVGVGNHAGGFDPRRAALGDPAGGAENWFVAP